MPIGDDQNQMIRGVQVNDEEAEIQALVAAWPNWIGLPKEGKSRVKAAHAIIAALHDAGFAIVERTAPCPCCDDRRAALRIVRADR